MLFQMHYIYPYISNQYKQDFTPSGSSCISVTTREQQEIWNFYVFPWIGAQIQLQSSDNDIHTQMVLICGLLFAE